jgi:monoamine oxidase
MAHAREQHPDFDITRSWALPLTPPPGDYESLEGYLRRIGFSEAQLHYTRRSFANASGDSPDKISAIVASEEWTDEEAGDGDFRVVGGYIRMLEGLATGLDIRLNTVVETITWNEYGVQVQTTLGDTFSGDAAIITLPIGVLQSNRVTFDPPLPQEKQATIQSLRMGPGLKLVFWFDEPIMPEGIGAFYSALNPPMIWSPSVGRDVRGQVITCFATGDYARTLHALGEAGALNAALQTLRTELGRDDLTPTAARWINWTADPYALGAYSTVPPGAHHARRAMASPTPPLFWAGEATVKNAWGATVHGAYVSGRRAADQTREYLLRPQMSS